MVPKLIRRFVDLLRVYLCVELGKGEGISVGFGNQCLKLLLVLETRIRRVADFVEAQELFAQVLRYRILVLVGIDEALPEGV